jgi:hypothetical protein
VPFVEVMHVDLDAQDVEGAHAADAEDDLLSHSLVVGPSVESACEEAILFRRGIEQVERCRSEADDAVDLERDLSIPEGNRDATAGVLEVWAEIARVLGVEDGAAGIHRLTRVTRPPEDADSGEWNPKSTCRFEVIPGENPETARVERQLVAEPVLHAEISYPWPCGVMHSVGISVKGLTLILTNAGNL